MEILDIIKRILRTFYVPKYPVKQLYRYIQNHGTVHKQMLGEVTRFSVGTDSYEISPNGNIFHIRHGCSLDWLSINEIKWITYKLSKDMEIKNKIELNKRNQLKKEKRKQVGKWLIDNM